MDKKKSDLIKAIVLVVVYFAFILFPPTAQVIAMWMFKVSNDLVITTMGQYAVPAILSIIFYGKEIIQQFTWFKEKPLKKIGMMFSYMIAIIITGAISSSLLGNSMDTQNQATILLMMRMIPLPYMVMLIVVFGPLLEEIIFRRILIKGLSNYMNKNIAMIISVALFTLAHTRELSDIIVYLPMSAIFAFSYIKSDMNLPNTWFIHMLNNGLGVIGMLLS